MGDTKPPRDDGKQKDGVPLPQIRNTVEQINAHICSAQAHLVAKSSEMIAAVEKTEISLPTAYRQVIDNRGESKLERLSEARVSLGSLLTPGVFRIQSVEVNLPVSLKDGAAADLRKEETASLKLVYEFVPLPAIEAPVTFRNVPHIEVEIDAFGPDPRIRGRCRASGTIEALDGETKQPLTGVVIHLGVEEGNVLPSTAKLDQKGRAAFELTGSAVEGGRFESTLTVLVKGAKRSFNINLGPGEKVR